MSTRAVLQEAIENPGFWDKPHVHSELASGLHGQKFYFDRLNQNKYKVVLNMFVSEAKDLIEERFYVKQRLGKIALLSVANGTNVFVPHLAQALGKDTSAALSEKLPSGQVILPDEAKARLKQDRPDLALVIEDVGTTGSKSSMVAKSAREAGAKRVEVLNLLLRSPTLPELTAAGVPYNWLIYRPTPIFTAEDCVTSGHCADGWELIKR